MKTRKICISIIFFITASIFSCYSAAQESDGGYSAITANDPNIQLDELKWLLKPLTKDEMIVEADAWQDLLKSKMQEIGNLEIQIMNYPKDEVEEQNADLKAQMQERVNRLRGEKNRLVDRFEFVLDALVPKGGEVDDYKTYIKAVSDIDITDIAINDIEDVSVLKDRFVAWLKSSEGGLRWLKNIVYFIIILVASYILANICGGITNN